MADPVRVKRIIIRVVTALAAAAAVGFILYFLFHGFLGKHPAVSLGDNREFSLPGTEAAAVPAVTSAALVENANAWNGRTVAFTGEVVGEVMVRGDMAWVHLNDDAYQAKNVSEGGAPSGYNSGHAVWVSAVEAGKITVCGDYAHGGDLVAVTGVFHAACREHGGDMDIHASSLAVVKPGRLVSHPFNLRNALIALALFLAAGGLYALRRITSRR